MNIRIIINWTVNEIITSICTLFIKDPQRHLVPLHIFRRRRYLRKSLRRSIIGIVNPLFKPFEVFFFASLDASPLIFAHNE